MKAKCIDCGTEMSLSPMRFQCICGGLLRVSHRFDGLDAERLKRIFDGRRAERNSLYASGVWRYKELIAPDLPEEAIVWRGEGNTGLYESDRLAAYAGTRKLWLKAQSENPSGSFKDNGMTAAVSHGRSLGCREFVCASTGNTAASLSMYCAWGGLKAHILVPEQGVAPNKLLQSAAYGADLCTYRGTYDDGIRFLEANAESLGWYVCNSLNPLRIEGQKSIIFEIAHDRNWALPDWIVLPGGALGNAAALGQGLEELHGLGFISKLPRIAIVQAEGASPFHRFASEWKKATGGYDWPARNAAADNNARYIDIGLQPEPRPSTRASALNIGNPPNWRKALNALRLTGGTTVSVADEEIMDAKVHIDRSGIGCEPAAAAALAGLHKLVRERTIDADETAVCLLTGNLLKDTDALNEYHNGPAYRSGSFRNRTRKVDLRHPEAFRQEA